MSNDDSKITKPSLSIDSHNLENDNAVNNKIALKVFGIGISIIAAIIVALLFTSGSNESSLPIFDDLSSDAASINKKIELSPELVNEDQVQATKEFIENEMPLSPSLLSTNEFLYENENPVVISNEPLRSNFEEEFEINLKNDLADAFVRIASLESELDRASTENSALESNIAGLIEQISELRAKEGKLISDYETQLDKQTELIENLNRELELQASNYADLELELIPTVEDYLPLVAIAPNYPTRAAQRGIEGWCLVSFTVDFLGNVIEESITVVDAEPADIFNRSSERAAARFKFQPRLVDGKGVEVANVRYLFRYDLED